MTTSPPGLVWPIAKLKLRQGASNAHVPTSKPNDATNVRCDAPRAGAAVASTARETSALNARNELIGCDMGPPFEVRLPATGGGNRRGYDFVPTRGKGTQRS